MICKEDTAGKATVAGATWVAHHGCYRATIERARHHPALGLLEEAERVQRVDNGLGHLALQAARASRRRA